MLLWIIECGNSEKLSAISQYFHSLFFLMWPSVLSPPGLECCPQVAKHVASKLLGTWYEHEIFHCLHILWHVVIILSATWFPLALVPGCQIRYANYVFQASMLIITRCRNLWKHMTAAMFFDYKCIFVVYAYVIASGCVISLCLSLVILCSLCSLPPHFYIM